MWYKDAVFYEVYVRAFCDSNGDGHGDLLGLVEKLDYLQELGVNCLWLLPIYPSPLKDDGYDIADYYSILPEYGSIANFETLLKEAHQRGIRVIADLVMNHTSDQHPWFQSARSSRHSPYRDYYVWSDTDKKYEDARIIFLDTEPSNWTWDEKAGQYYWHRFYASQPDLNFDNSKVQDEMINIARFWLDLGIDGFRADAVPYLFEREGTNCENLTETHAYLKKLRAFMDEHYPDRILLCEANQWPENVRPYFGNGDEFHMAFHFPVMPRIYMALKKGRVDDMLEILRRTPPIPENCQWCTFLRNHDELTLEMVTPEERQWMWEQYAPEPRMRLNQGIRRRLAPLLDNDRRKIELANSLLFTLPGSPIIYYGDEIGLGDNVWLDDRNGVRTPMQWDDNPTAGFTKAQPFAPVLDRDYSPKHVNVAAQIADPDSLFSAIRRMISIHKKHQAFGWGSFEWIDAGSNAIAAYERMHVDETMLILNNLSDRQQTIYLDKGRAVNAFTGENVSLGSLTIKPFEYLWFTLKS
jgi:maltose alpha-D-glucosyltransferase / alpha-amylase